ncbi:MAG: hypothetical protein EOP06_26890 [Proteobacteria bacterium]|nr:MAG: hypothetical protein EOP06_26890 [Pseudomonadota bacterium]
MEDQTGIRRLEDATPNSTALNVAEHLFNIFRAGLSMHPIGGAFASLMNDYIPSTRTLRLENFAQQVAGDIHALANRVDENYVRTDEFAFIFESCFRGAAENYQQEKLRAFRNILVNSLIRTDYSGEEREYFIHMVNTLSVLHIQVIRKALACPGEYDSEGRFLLYLSGVDVKMVESAYRELVQLQLLSNTDRYARPGYAPEEVVETSLLFYEEPTLERLGRRFVNFCLESPTEQNDGAVPSPSSEDDRDIAPQ